MFNAYLLKAVCILVSVLQDRIKIQLRGLAINGAYI